MERWAKIQHHETYEVSSLGRVRNQRGLILKQFPNREGYLRLQLGDRKNYAVHILVARAFLPNPHNKPEVNHKRGNKSNNRASRLEWATKSENLRHAHTLRRRPKKTRPVLATDQASGFRHIFPSIRAVVQLGCGTNAPSVHACCWGKSKTHNGFAFQFCH